MKELIYDLVGRKAIMAALDVLAWRTALAKRAKGAPIVRRVDGKWAANAALLRTWINQPPGQAPGQPPGQAPGQPPGQAPSQARG